MTVFLLRQRTVGARRGLAPPERSPDHLDFLSPMSDSQLRNVLKSVDVALDIYRKHEGALTAFEISVKSMLVVVRSQVAAQLCGAPPELEVRRLVPDLPSSPPLQVS